MIMTTAIIHGDPGSYKTSTLISDFLVPAIQKGRVVVTNIRGVKTPEEIAEIYNFDLPDTAQIILVSFDQVGFEQMARFFHWAPAGALILMDEGQRIYPTRLRSFSEYDLLTTSEDGRPRSVEDAFDSHRHMNWDIYISTTNIGKVHKEIRAVAEFGYRHKNMASIFAFMKGRYKKVTHNAENSGTALSHEITSAIIKIDPRCFNAYNSTATGKVKDTESAKSVSPFSRPKVQIIFLLFLVIFAFLFSKLTSDSPLPPMFSGNPKPATSSPHASPGVISHQAPAHVSSGVVPAGVDLKNPFGGLEFYVVASINSVDYFQINYLDGSFITLTSDDLKLLGFQIARINSSMVKLTFENEIVYAVPKPTPKHVAQSANPVQPDNLGIL